MACHERYALVGEGANPALVAIALVLRYQHLAKGDAFGHDIGVRLVAPVNREAIADLEQPQLLENLAPLREIVS